MIDCIGDRYLLTIPELPGVAGVLVSEQRNMIFTSNRREDTIGIFDTRESKRIRKVKVGCRPNGLAYDSMRQILVAANVGEPTVAGAATASIVDVGAGAMVGSVPMPGRTRWAVFDQGTGRVLQQAALSGPPDAIFFNAERHHLYVAIGDPGVIGRG